MVASEGASAGTSGGTGRPGGLARLGWHLSKKGKEDSKRNAQVEVKGIEMVRAASFDGLHRVSHGFRGGVLLGEGAPLRWRAVCNARPALLLTMLRVLAA